MKIVITKEELWDLIAVMMVYCASCHRVSAPAIKSCLEDESGANWELWDWQGDPSDISQCQVAMSGQIAGLKRIYHLKLEEGP